MNPLVFLHSDPTRYAIGKVAHPTVTITSTTPTRTETMRQWQERMAAFFKEPVWTNTKAPDDQTTWNPGPTPEDLPMNFPAIPTLARDSAQANLISLLEGSGKPATDPDKVAVYLGSDLGNVLVPAHVAKHLNDKSISRNERRLRKKNLKRLIEDSKR